MQHFPVFIIPILVAIITQTTKFVIFSLKKGFKPEYFFTHGHMPSSHSALAISLVTSVGVAENFQGGAFAVAVVFALVILDDALRVRMYLGDQGRYLNMLVQSLNLDKEKFPRLKEHVGHRTSEVIAGLIFGFLLSLLFLWLFGYIQ